ncbi:MAG: cyclic lactone autoinducer peptide [Bacillota bacterium]|nr:cyclic lactone autoinducer peptide [Bacillota bacterium]
MKRLLYKWSHVLASFFAIVAVVGGIRPNCTLVLYEPEVPEELMR